MTYIYLHQLRAKTRGEWRILHKKEIIDLYKSHCSVRWSNQSGCYVNHVAWMIEMRNEYRMLVEKPPEKRPFRMLKSSDSLTRALIRYISEDSQVITRQNFYDCKHSLCSCL